MNSEHASAAAPGAAHPAVFSGVSIAGTGSYLPERVLSNAELEKMVDTTNDWIVERTGIRERRIAAHGECTSDMAAQAARRALADAGAKAEDLDLIVVATITPDMVFPNTACFVQNLIGAKRAFCFDLEAACSGFLYGVSVARQFIAAGGAQTALVIGAEKLSAVTDWQDRATCVLFGDGAGAAVLRRSPDRRGVLAWAMGSDGSLTNLLMIPAGGSRQPACAESLQRREHFMKMAGREVFKHAVRCMCDATREALRRANVSASDVRWFIPHQANLRIIQAIADRLDVPLERFHLNLHRCGNMSAASVPVALDEANRAGLLRRGDLIALTAFGGGFTWGSMVIEW